jgi:alkaline phosphatase
MIQKSMKIITILAVLMLAFSANAAKGNGNGGKIRSGKIKNIIVMISDGWGYNQIDATNYYQHGKTGVQVYEHFPVRLGMSTYMIPGDYNPNAAWAYFNYFKYGATDSAAAATTMSTGVKTYGGAIGVDLDKNSLKHAIAYAEEVGKATGVVTSVEFSHATPAGFAAHNVARGNYAEIANEMIYDSALEVIMGAGAPDYDDDGKNVLSVDREKYVGGPATFADLTDDYMVEGADADGDGFADDWTVIRSREDFQKLATGATPSRVIGLPYAYQTLQHNRGGDYYADPYAVPLIATVPTLEEMAKAALNVLDNDKDGLFLMIEAGAVDWAGHGNASGRLIEEQIDFNNTVEAVVAWVDKNSNWGETLLVVTGDHETGYLTGPDSGLYTDGPSWEPVVNNGTGNLPGMEWHSESHTNQLIPFFAKGAAARIFKFHIAGEDSVRGPYIDNTAIGNVIIDILSN